MEKILKIGIAVKPQGVRGEIKIRPLTDDPERFKKLKTVLIDGNPVRVLSVRAGGSDVFVALDGVTDRNAAEAYRGKFLCVERENAVPLAEGRYFIADLIGAAVINSDGKKIGSVYEITEGRTDVIWLHTDDDKTVSFPFLKKAIKSVDLNNGVITVYTEIFAEIACYED